MSRPLAEVLTEALAGHEVIVGSRDSLICLRCQCTWQSGNKTAHLADVAAQVVATWLSEQRETVAFAVNDVRVDMERPTEIAAAALAALVDAIGGRR